LDVHVNAIQHAHHVYDSSTPGCAACTACNKHPQLPNGSFFLLCAKALLLLLLPLCAEVLLEGCGHPLGN
jgi:hypothetical protein